MGMDIYGLNPQLTEERPEINWDTSTEESRKEYFKIIEEWEENNPGYYFRANLWSWRPIHTLIDSVLAMYDLNWDTSKFGENSGGGFKTQEECDTIANGIEEILGDMIEAGKETIYLNLGMWVSYEPTGSTFNVPEEIQDELNEEYTNTYVQAPIVASNGQLVVPAHSVSINHIKKFVNFLRHCGGFKIW
jgi:hypothetical protein